MTTEISDEEQRRQVVIAIMSCNFSNYVISEGCKLASCTLKPRILTKYGYMSTRKRDFRSSKAKPNVNKNTINDLADQLESNLGKAAYSAIQTEPSSYLKDYKNTVFSEVLQTVNKDHVDYNNFKNIIKLDLNGQLIGNSGLDKLSKQMVKSPVEILVLTENDIDDDGILEFASTFKTLPNLKELYLNSNKITDVGVEALFNPYNYSKSLQLINLARNPIGRKSAFFLGSMFTTSRLSKLESVLIGDRMGNNLGDDFLKVFIALLTTNSARPLKRFSCPSAGLTEVGIMILATLLLCNCGIEELNMTRNAIVNPMAKRMLLLALQANNQLTSLHLHQCALSSKDIEKFEQARKHKSTNLLWHEATFLATSVARQLSECDRLRMEVEMSTYVKPPVEKIDRMLTRTIGSTKAGPSRWRPNDTDRLRETRKNRDKIPIRVHPLFHEYSPPLTASILVAAIEATMLMNASMVNRTYSDMVDTRASANQSQQQQQQQQHLQPPIAPPVSNSTTTTTTSLQNISHDISIIRAPSPQRRIMISKNSSKMSVSLVTPSNPYHPSPDTRPFLLEKSTSIPLDYYPIRRSSINFITTNSNIGNTTNTGKKSPTIRIIKESQPLSPSKGFGNESVKGNSGTNYSKPNNPSPSAKLTTTMTESSNNNMTSKKLTIITGKSDSKCSSDSIQDIRDPQQQQQQQHVDISPTNKTYRDQNPTRNPFTVKSTTSPLSVASDDHIEDSSSKFRINHLSNNVGESTPQSLSSVCEEGPFPSVTRTSAISVIRKEDSYDLSSPIKRQSHFISQIEGGVVTFSPTLIKALSTCDSLIPWVSEMECALTQTMVECMREVTLGAEGKFIIKEVKNTCTRRRNASRKSKSQMQITLNKLQSQMKSKGNARGPTRTIVRQSSIVNREHTVELESLLIIIEDYVSSLLEQSTACERGIASIHKLRLDSYNQQLNRPPPPLKYSIWMPYTSTLSYAAYFNHYINIARPSSSSYARLKTAPNNDFNSLTNSLTSLPATPTESETEKKKTRLNKVMEKNKAILQAEETHHRVTREVDNKETNHRIYGVLTDNTFHIITARKSPAALLPPIPPRPLVNDNLQHDPLFANLTDKMSVFTRNLSPMKSPPPVSATADKIIVQKQNSSSSSHYGDVDRKPKSKQHLRKLPSRELLSATKSQSQSGRDLQARFTPALPDDKKAGGDTDDDVTDMTDTEAFDLFFAAAGNTGPIYAPIGGLGEVERPINSAENWLGKKEEDFSTKNIREGLLSVYIKPKMQHEGSITHHDSDEMFETSAVGRSSRRYLIRAGSVVHRAVMLEQEEERGEALPVEVKRNYFRKLLRLNDRFSRKLKKRIEFYKYSDTDFIAQQQLEIVIKRTLTS